MTTAAIDTINAELRRRHKGLVTTLGWKERAKHSQPPCVRWVADNAVFGAPVLHQGDDEPITQPLLGRTLRYRVECWGKDPIETQALVKSVMRVCLRTLTAPSCTIESEEWEGIAQEGSGAAILGELATLTIGIRDDIEDDEETTVAPPTTTTVGGGYA